MSINGAAADFLPSQERIEVEYLRTDQQMLLPAGLAMSHSGEEQSRVKGGEPLRIFYRQARRMPYDRIRQLALGEASLAEIRDAVSALPSTPLEIDAPQFESWLSDGTIDSSSTADTVYTYFSQALLMNFDVRDFGVLLRDDMTISDGEWQDPTRVVVTSVRLAVKLHPFTLHTIAAANCARVGGFPLAAWVRACGVASGVMPSPTSRWPNEHQFTNKFPSYDDYKKVLDYGEKFGTGLATFCLNVLAMFGLFHLSKDRTHREQDAEMENAGWLYLSSLRAYVPDDVMADVMANQEAMLRISAHPFGIGQTYWVAQSLARLGLLPFGLANRAGARPPTVRRIMMVRAASREWARVPLGAVISQLLEESLGLVNAECKVIMRSPPSYSSLHILYGVDAQAKISTEAQAAVDRMMPVVCAYARAVHGYVAHCLSRNGKPLELGPDDVAPDQEMETHLWECVWSDSVLI